ncbi:DegQ family serine endoprotease [Kingella bonacorsii]|jgi:peptidase Do|uniref:Probable periplasmic serine endoprotease DegP-like n=1 Tax=Kingella bonacorsii TaxID=2796361 RepID=A0ABS1BW19_9NEIS|nr:DegQ family serine endoprotease [Kingella bonacorsii]MBK0397349.1 DegQ family serine endoprotease [Kingella bonacorsii]
MNKSLLSLTILAALALAACGDNTPTPPAASEPPSIIKQTEPPKADGTVGMMLPDFAQLVAREGGAVVNIQASRERDEDDNNGNEDPFMEFFKRLTPNAPDFSEDDNATSANFGSGFIISPDGYILTNTHVIKGMTNIKVTLNDKRQYPAKLIGQDEKSDVALLKIEAKNLPTVKIGNPDELRSGEWVAAIGAPFGFENSVTSGIVSAKNRTLPDDGYMPFIQTDVAINPGNSGGPLFNLKGQVVGINSQIYSRSGGFMGISFAIPINVAMNVADQLKATGKVERGQLGVVIQEVSYDLAKTFGLDKATGALVAKVLAGSPAERGGLKVGDIIRSVNGNEVRSSSDLPMTISSLKPNQTVKLGVWRKGQMLDVEIKLGTQNDIAAKSERQSSDRGDNVDDFQFAAAGLTLIVNSNGNIVVSNVKGIAANAGLRRGDILLEVAGKEVHSQEEFNAAIESAGKNIPLLVQRGSSNLFMALILP